MAEEFKNDPMMEELHQIRAEHSREAKNTRGRRRSRDLEEKAEAFVASYGYKLVPTKRGTNKLVKAA
jgi:hypothetical protein